MPMNNPSTLHTQEPQTLGHLHHSSPIVDPYQLVGRPCRVRQRAKQVEEGPDAQSAPHRSGMSQRRVMRGRKEESDPNLSDTSLRELRVRAEFHAKRLKDIGAPRTR